LAQRPDPGGHRVDRGLAAQVRFEARRGCRSAYRRFDRHLHRHTGKQHARQFDVADTVTKRMTPYSGRQSELQGVTDPLARIGANNRHSQ
jgi:hypothetical protein